MSITCKNNICPYTLEKINNINKNKVFTFQQNGHTYKVNLNSILTSYKMHGSKTKNPLTRGVLPLATLQRLNDLIKRSQSNLNKKLNKNERLLLTNMLSLFVPNKSKPVSISKLGQNYLNNISFLTDKTEINKISNLLQGIIGKLGDSINFSQFNISKFT